MGELLSKDQDAQDQRSPRIDERENRKQYKEAWPAPDGCKSIERAPILDRISHKAHRLELKGESMRRKQRVVTDNE